MVKASTFVSFVVFLWLSVGTPYHSVPVVAFSPDCPLSKQFPSTSRRKSVAVDVGPEYPLLLTDLVCPDGNCEEDSRAKTLDGRLLCAATLAYGVSQPYVRAASFLPGTTAKRVSRGVNSALIGRTIDGIVISFRGTQGGSPLDWLQNAALFLADADELPGKIHYGFLRATKSLYDPLKSILLDMLQEAKSSGHSQKVYLTGHSKGGSLASIAAMLLARDEDVPNATFVCSFGAARLGNSVFRDAFDREICQRTYENDLDIIPFLPPSQATMEAMDENTTQMMNGILWKEPSNGYRWDYQPIGQRAFIDQNQSIVYNVTLSLDNERIWDIENRTLLSFRKFRAAHCSSCPDGRCDGGYFRAVAPEVCKASRY